MPVEYKRPTIDDMLKNGLLKRGSDPSLDIISVPFGIGTLDEILGGGIPRGRNTLFVGDYSSGKTFLSQMLIKAVQHLGGTAAYVDAERSYDREWFAASGVDTDNLMVSVPEYGEQAVDVCVALLEARTDIVVLDSIASLIPSVEDDESAEKATIGLHARLVTKAYKKCTVANKSSIFIGINQLRREIGPYGRETYPGGEYQKYASHIILRIKREQWIKDKEKRVGFDMSIETVKNKVASPWRECTIPFYFSGELDVMIADIDTALMKGIIKQAGPYYGWEAAGKKWLGKTAMRLEMKEQPELYQQLLKEIGENGSIS